MASGTPVEITFAEVTGSGHQPRFNAPSTISGQCAESAPGPEYRGTRPRDDLSRE
jgi:hypothetical protein